MTNNNVTSTKNNQTDMRAYHNNPILKDQFVRLVKAHQDADRIIQGTYWDMDEQGVYSEILDDGRGCAVGCSINSISIITGRPLVRDNHELYEEYLGIPTVLALMEDNIFESLSREEAVRWPVRFAEAVPVGADLSKVWYRFAHWMITNSTCGLSLELSRRTDKLGLSLMSGVARMLDRLAKGKAVRTSTIKSYYDSVSSLTNKVIRGDSYVGGKWSSMCALLDCVSALLYEYVHPELDRHIDHAHASAMIIIGLDHADDDEKLGLEYANKLLEIIADTGKSVDMPTVPSFDQISQAIDNIEVTVVTPVTPVTSTPVASPSVEVTQERGA